MPESIIHRCPVRGEGFTPCCSRSPFELPSLDRMTLDPDLVTCAGNAEAELRYLEGATALIAHALREDA